MAYADAKLDIEEDELLEICLSEFRSSIGFEFDADLIGQRERATNYAKGVMTDVPALPGRSRAVDTHVSDVIETALPSLIDILASEGSVTFDPVSPGDEQAAEQETDYVRNVFWKENGGRRLIETYLRDALGQKTGVFTWWWEDAPEPEPQTYEGQSLADVMLLQSSNPKAQFEVTSSDATAEDGTPLLDVVMTPAKKQGRCCVDNIDPNDFTVARDATSSDVQKLTYCAYRSRPRAQELKAMGIDGDLVDNLPTWSLQWQNAAQLARDTVSESLQQIPGSLGDLRQVMVVTHFIRLIRDGRNQVYKVVTDWANAVVLHAEKVNRIDIAAAGPFMQAHRFYAVSLADMAIEIQRIKTALTRMTLDSGYFAINQRPIVNMLQANDLTMSDILNNVPGAPIRVDGAVETAVQMFSGEGLNYDPLQHLEYFASQGEQRTGVQRNMQGLSPDTLHDRAGPAMAMLVSAARRLRMMAENLAEGLRDTFLGLHAMLCENATEATQYRKGSQWIPVNPSEWARRENMTVDIGEGAGNSQYAQQISQLLGQIVTQLVTGQGGPNGPLANPRTILAAAKMAIQSLGLKDPEQYLPQPGEFQPPPPQPTPEMLKAQSDAQAKAQELALKQQQIENEANKTVLEHRRETQKIANDHEQSLLKIANERDKLVADSTLKHTQISAETNTKVYQLHLEAAQEQERIDLQRAQLEQSDQQHADNVAIQQDKLDRQTEELSTEPQLDKADD